MTLSGNTILITGGGSGIGLALAEALKSEGNQVIVAGRSQEKLEQARGKGFKTLTVDMTDAASIRKLAETAIKEYPALNFVIHNAGIMKNEKVTRTDNAKIEEETVFTNFLGPMRLTDALLPHFLKQKSAVIMTVTSGLAYVPLALTPTYSATKAAIHSYTESLRFQLAGTSVEVKELVPPYVRTSLMGDRQAADQNAMPLDEFISEVLKIMKENPTAPEILVGRVMAQRSAAWSGEKAYNEFYKMMNERLLAARKSEWDAL